ncbi:MAG: hypothetical protein COA97_01895 [Flavobacteriales bacterium]|nr:MAG: hypothetical protein COA97_01895 [Flavobacteriales bacterium]
MQTKVTLIIFLTILIYGCGSDSIENGNSENGKNKTFYESGELKSENNFIDNVKEGVEIIYFKSGNVEKKYNYYKGQLHGLYISYNENGIKKQSSRYLNGELSGCVKNFYKNGKTKETALFYKDSQLCFGEINTSEEASIEDFFIDMEIPEVVHVGDDMQLNIRLYNADMFADCNLVEGTYTEDGKGLIIGEKRLINNNFIEIGLETNELGYHNWSGTVKCTALNDSTKYAAYPIYITYKIIE